MPRRRKVPVDEQENVPVAPKALPKFKEKPAKKLKLEPDWMKGDGIHVVKLILSVQKSDCNNTKIMAELTKLYNKMGRKPFVVSFMKSVTSCLIREESDEFAPRVLKFIGLFVASFGEEYGPDETTHLLIQDVFEEILSITSKLYYVRARICLLVSNIMASFTQKAEIDESIINHVVERMLTSFIKDISPVVRQNAIMALQRLQDPDKSEDQVTRAYVFHMETDPAAKVRQTAITSIAKKLPIIPNIIDRLQDIDEKVRRHTYLQMASFPVKSYKIIDRIKIMKAGLYDRSDVVKKTVNNLLLPNWIAAYENDYAEFIRAFRLDACDDDLVKFRNLAQDALTTILKKRKINDIVNFLNLNKENEFTNCLSADKFGSLEWLIVWKVVIKLHQDHIEGKGKDECNQQEDEDESDEDKNETISNIETMPELLVLCEYIEKFISEFKVTNDAEEKFQKLNFNHCIILLLEVAQLNDFGDEIGRNRLQELLKKILLEYDVSDHVIKEISQLMELLISKADVRLKFFSEIVNKMVNVGPISEYSRTTIIDELIGKANVDTQVKANALKLEMMNLKERESIYVKEKQYAKAHVVSEEYSEKSQALIELLKPYASEASLAVLEKSFSSLLMKKNTPSDILKNLRICFFAVFSKCVKSLTPEIVQIYNNFVRYNMESADVATRVWSLKTATAYSLLYEPLSKDVYMVLKSQLFKSNNVVIWETSINCIIDLILRYSIDKMDKHDELNADASGINNSTQNRGKKGGRTLYSNVEDEEEPDDSDMVKNIEIVQMLTHILDNNTDRKVDKAVTIGLCKLILHGQFYTREIMSRFLIAYFNPATEPEINQTLGVFLESIIRMKKQESLHDALVPTLVALLEAPHESPLHEIKIQVVLKYVIDATRPVFCSNGLNLHNTIGLKLIEIMKNNPESKEILKIFSKELLTLELSDDPLLKKDIVTHIENLMPNINVDVRTKKNIADFRDILKGTYKPALKFSSTAMSINVEENEDAGVPEEDDDEDDKEEEKEAESPQNAYESANIDSSNVLLAEHSTETSATKSPQADLEPSKDVSLPADDEIVPSSQPDEMEVPESPEDDDTSSDEEQNETVIESMIVDEESDAEEVPATPQTPARKLRKAIKLKRQLELSLSKNSPLRKNPRNGNSPKPTTPIRTRRTLATESAPATPKTPKTPKTPGNVAKTPKTPKTPGIVATPSSERVTRNQSRQELISSTTMTRSASKQVTVDKPIGRSISATSPKSKNAPKQNNDPKVVKKSVLPVPTKTSLIRASRQAAMANNPVVNPASKPSTSKPSSEKTVEDRPRRKATDGKLRPRWN